VALNKIYHTYSVFEYFYDNTVETVLLMESVGTSKF
jgi:hypothetical protein